MTRLNDLLNAELVIADLSFLNPNAFYEIGIRHMAQKPIIHMQLATQEPPFDLSLYRAIKFSLTKHRDLGVAAAELKRDNIQYILADSPYVENEFRDHAQQWGIRLIADFPGNQLYQIE